MSVSEDIVAGLAASGLTLRGERGPKGDKGEKGDRGEKGEKGDKGDQGNRGLQGERGAKGDKGETGDAAPRPVRAVVEEHDAKGKVRLVRQYMDDGTSRQLAVRRDAQGRFHELVAV